ncbi:MAG: alanine racemase [Actinomycetota bacterium]|jgi:alanine racemase|nr:alanine racemase [Actinomycetota bacterium]
MSLTRAEIVARGHSVWAEVDLDAIRHNIRALAERAEGAEVMGVVKGYAYGHGNPESARAMLEGGATRLGVARVAEGIHLRDAGIEVPIHVFTEPPYEAAPTMIERDLTPTVYTEPFAQALADAAASAGSPVAVHVKLDTGMHRVGLLADDLPDALRRLKSLDGIVIEGAWSHLAVADVPDHPFTRKQLELFEELLGQIERAGVVLKYRHLANSAATIAHPDTRFDLVRCGIAAYGLWPSAELMGTIDLHAALALRARVNMVKQVPAGDAVSYGLNYELKEASKIVTITAGYADGYDRRLSGRSDVVIDGQRHRVSGTVCMDQFMVDIGDADVETGAVATLIGDDGEDGVSAEELALHIGTINYEVTTRIPSRVPRVFLNEAI